MMSVPTLRRSAASIPARAALLAARAALFVVGTALLVVGTGCAPAGEDGAPPERGATAADLASIERLHREYVAAHNDADADRMMALWTEDAVLMPMDEPTITGRAAIREHYEQFFDQTPSRIDLSPAETRVAGDWAFERIQVTVSMPGGDRREREARVKYLWILERQQDGSWRIARAIYNLDGSVDEEEGASV